MLGTEAPAGEEQMPLDRVSTVLTAYFKQPYEEYGELALEIKESGGLTREEVSLIESKVLHVDAIAIVRHSGCDERISPSRALTGSSSRA